MTILERPIILFPLTYIMGLIGAVIWLSFGESWQIFGDAVHYVSVYNGELAPAPWGYRIMTPFLAQLLPWDVKTNFAMISINSIALTTGVLSLYGKKIGFTLKDILFLIFFWMISYTFVYYSTAIIRADAPMLLILATIFLLSKYRVSATILLILISFGTFFHEMILISIPALWLDKIFSGKLTGGMNYKFYELVIISIGSLFIVIIARSFFINVLPGSDLGSPVISILEYTGGSVKHALRIYAAYGPVLLFCLFFVVIKRLSSVVYPFAGLLLITISATFYAADTLRIMSILYLPVLLYATQYLLIHLKNEKYKTFLSLTLLQIMFSFTVFGNLRTFETSIILNMIAITISFVSLAFCITIFRKKFHV